VFYLLILASHILLSMAALPLILVTAALSLTRRFSLHKRWARWTFPIWSYVSVTGVLVFALLKTFGQG
jgi:putative membrane protein